MERKDIVLEFKDLDSSKRTAVIMHSVYNSIDRVEDISHKGMFTKTWQERKPKFCINHNYNLQPGTVKRVWDDDKGAYTEVKFGNWTLGNDALEQADSGIFTGASFEYAVVQKDFSTIKGRKVRNLREVKHGETSLLTVEACHPEAGIVSLVKSLEDIEDVEGLCLWHNEQIEAMKAYVNKLENYCRKSKASDETIISLQQGLIEYKKIISEYNTVLTQLATEPGSSVRREWLGTIIL